MRSEDYSNKIKKKSSWEEVTDAFMGEVAEEEEKRKLGNYVNTKFIY